MYELISLGADAIMTLDHVFGRKLIEMIIYGIAPMLGTAFSLQQRHQAHPLDILRNRRASQVKEGGSIIDILNHILDFSSAL